MKPTVSYRIFTVFNYLFLFILGLICLLPLVNIIALSFSHNVQVAANRVTFWPLQPHLLNYRIIFTQTSMLRNMSVSLARVVLGTSLNMFLVLMTAYPLSKSSTELKGRNVLMWIFVVPLFLSAGLLPSYINISRIGLMDKFLVLILPGAVNVWNIIMMTNFFRTMPKEVGEAAYVDGASHMQILFKVYIPLNTAAIATLALFSAVGHWNAWFDGMIYIRNQINQPVQTALRSLMNVSAVIVGQESLYTNEELAMLGDRSLTAAKIVFTTFPILLVYPFVQKYFVKGVIIGSVKG